MAIRLLKWFALLVVGLIIVGVGYRMMTLGDRNAAVAEDIRNQPDGDRARRAMLLWLDDGTMYPVNYLKEDPYVYMGIDGLWWREFTDEGAPVRMLIRGREYMGHAKVVLDDPVFTEDVFSRLRPTVPEWLPDWLNGKLVVITLDSTETGG